MERDQEAVDEQEQEQEQETVGEGGASAEFKSWLDDHNLRDSVTFVGAIPHHEVPSHLAALDIGFVPDSNFYGSSLKLFEYMAAGKASVTPAYRPFSEVVEHGKDGLLFEPRNCVFNIF